MQVVVTTTACIYIYIEICIWQPCARLRNCHTPPDLLPFPHVLPDLPPGFFPFLHASRSLSFPAGTPARDFLIFVIVNYGPTRLLNFRAKIMLGLGFDLWSAGNQQRELTTSPMTLIVEQAKGNTVFDKFVVTLIIGNKFVEPAPR